MPKHHPDNKKYAAGSKAEGIIFLSVPDMRYTFDKSMAVTTLRHFVQDHQAGPAHDNEQHFMNIRVRSYIGIRNYSNHGACHRLFYQRIYRALAKIKNGGAENFYTEQTLFWCTHIFQYTRQMVFAKY